MAEPDEIESLFDANRKLWDERVGVHLAPGGYDLTALRAGWGRLRALVETELAGIVGDLVGKRVIHLQCHIGDEVLSLAQRGAEVVGVDFSSGAGVPVAEVVGRGRVRNAGGLGSGEVQKSHPKQDAGSMPRYTKPLAIGRAAE